jgi:hypothetical protein
MAVLEDPNALVEQPPAVVNPVVTAPVVTEELTPSQQFDVAVTARDPRKAMEVATRNNGTPVAVAAVKAADLMLKGEEAFKSMISPVDKAGGLGTPEGNLAASKQAQKLFQQEEPRLKDAFIHYLTGNSDMARALITGGTVTKSIVTDVNGKLIKVAKNQLGDIVDVEDSLGNKLTREEYDKRYVGRQKFEDTLGYISQKQQQEANTKALKESQQANNAFASVAPELESKYGQIYDDLGYIRSMGKGLGAKEYADVLKFTSNSLGTADSVSKGNSTLDQANQNRSANIGKTLTSEQTSALGFGRENTAGWKWTNKGIETQDGKQSVSFDELKQKQSTENKTNDLTRNYQQTRRNLIESKKFQQLDTGDQNRLLGVLENSYQVSQKQMELQAKHGTPTFMVLPSAVDIEDQYGLGQAKAVQGIFNAKALQLYSAYEKKMLAESGGIAPDPKELEVGFTRTQAYKTLINEAKLAQSRVMDEPNRGSTPSVDVRAGGREFREGQPPSPAVPPAQAPRTSPSASRPPPTEQAVPQGVPRGSVKSGRVSSDGKPLWKAPDGSLHTED